jgi:hypothetical protein
MKKILSQINPRDIISMKQTEKMSQKMISASPNDISLLQAFRSLAVLIYYHLLFEELYYGKEEMDIVVFSLDLNLFRSGYKRFKPFEIWIERSADGRNMKVIDENLERKRQVLDYPTPFTLASILSQYIFDPKYANFKMTEVFDDLDLHPEEMVTPIHQKRNSISRIVNELIDYGSDIDMILQSNGINSNNPLFYVIQDQMLNILKSMI